MGIILNFCIVTSVLEWFVNDYIHVIHTNSCTHTRWRFDVLAKEMSNDDGLLPWTNITSPAPISYSTELYETLTADLNSAFRARNICSALWREAVGSDKKERRVNVGRKWESRV